MEKQAQTLIELEKTGSVKTFRVTKGAQTVQDLLKELKLDNKYFAILIDGKRAELDAVVDENTEIMILPKIAGG